jgi:hypothetical protein
MEFQYVVEISELHGRLGIDADNQSCETDFIGTGKAPDKECKSKLA